MKNKKFSIKNRLASFSYAFSGLKTLWHEEHNSRIHFVVGFLAILLGIYFSISSYEWIAIIFSIAIVFVIELINSALENLANFISPEKNNLIKKAKDLAAAAVLVAALMALSIGLMIFIPKLSALLL